MKESIKLLLLTGLLQDPAPVQPACKLYNNGFPKITCNLHTLEGKKDKKERMAQKEHRSDKTLNINRSLSLIQHPAGALMCFL